MAFELSAASSTKMSNMNITWVTKSVYNQSCSLDNQAGLRMKRGLSFQKFEKCRCFQRRLVILWNMDEILDSRIKFLQFDDWTELIFIIGNPAKPNRGSWIQILFHCLVNAKSVKTVKAIIFSSDWQSETRFKLYLILFIGVWINYCLIEGNCSCFRWKVLVNQQLHSPHVCMHYS